MENYVCRTCLYVCDNEFSFRKLEKVKGVLELFVPEIKTFIGKYSLICEQCYYFLKNVEKFKIKCIETQKKLYSMNIETIKNTQKAILQSVASEVLTRGQHDVQTSQNNLKTKIQPKPIFKRFASGSNTKNTNKRPKQCLNTPATSTATFGSEITLAGLLNTAEKPDFTQQKQISGSKNNSFLNTSAADDLLQLFNYEKDTADLRGFRDFTVKEVNSNKELVESVISNARKNNSDIIMNYAEDEYMTKNDLVSAGLLSDDSNKSITVEGQAEQDSDDDIEIIEIDISDDTQSAGENSTGTVELKIANSSKARKNIDNTKQTPKTVDRVTSNESTEPVSVSVTTIIKKEIPEEENPGFFNKQSADGYYKCRLCNKQYKTSKGLYKHTKKLHADEVKFHHCDYCSFFTLWRSSLMRHYSVFHMSIFEKNNSFIAKCYHCEFKTRSKEQLSRHIIDTHVNQKFTECNLCRSRFPDGEILAQHIEKEHNFRYHTKS